MMISKFPADPCQKNIDKCLPSFKGSISAGELFNFRRQSNCVVMQKDAELVGTICDIFSTNWVTT